MLHQVEKTVAACNESLQGQKLGRLLAHGRLWSPVYSYPALADIGNIGKLLSRQRSATCRDAPSVSQFAWNFWQRWQFPRAAEFVASSESHQCGPAVIAASRSCQAAGVAAGVLMCSIFKAHANDPELFQSMDGRAKLPFECHPGLHHPWNCVWNVSESNWAPLDALQSDGNQPLQ